MHCILDTDDDALTLGVEARPFMIKPNEYEMERLSGRSLRTVGDYLAQARRFNRKGIAVVVVLPAKPKSYVWIVVRAYWKRYRYFSPFSLTIRARLCLRQILNH